MLRSILQGVSEILWPPRTCCLLCEQRFPAQPPASLVCTNCWDSFSFSSSLSRCGRCSRPITRPGRLCVECVAGGPVGQVFALGLHDGALREAIHHAKFGRRQELARHLGRHVAELIPGRYGFMVPVPLHPARERQRGYNQAHLLADGISERLGTPLVSGLLIRSRSTDSQVSLDRLHRLANLRGAFGLADGRPVPWQGAYVLLVDDVLTTGATAAAAAEMLLGSGAARVDLAVAAVSTRKIDRY